MSGEGRSVHALPGSAPRLFGTSGLRRVAAVRMPVGLRLCAASQGSFGPEQAIERRINRPPEVASLLHAAHPQGAPSNGAVTRAIRIRVLRLPLSRYPL